MHKLHQVKVINGLFDEADLKEINKQLKKSECSEVSVVYGTDQAILISVDSVDLEETTTQE